MSAFADQLLKSFMESPSAGRRKRIARGHSALRMSSMDSLNLSRSTARPLTPTSSSSTAILPQDSAKPTAPASVGVKPRTTIL